MTAAARENAAKAVTKKLGVALEIVPAKDQTAPKWTEKDGGGGKRAHGVRYHVTVKRAYNAAQAFAFDYWGSVSDADTHKAPSTFDVLIALRGMPASTKFFTADELQQLAELATPAEVTE